MSTINIAKIRPASWKVYVQGNEEARYVSRFLSQSGLTTGEPEPTPGLTEPPLFAIVASPAGETPLTEEELVAILEKDEKLDLKFEA